MRQFILIYILFSAFIGTVRAQYSNLKDANLKGNVRSVKLVHMKPETDGDSIWAEIAPDNDPFWFNGYVDTYYVFDREGRTSEYHTYFTEDADDNKTVNIYDKEGLLKEQRFFSDGRKMGSMQYAYDSERRIIKVLRFDENGEETDCVYHIRHNFERLPVNKGHNNFWVYKYDNDGRCIEEKCLFPDGRVNYRHIFFYDEKGRQERVITFDKDNMQNVSTSYQYDSKGRLSSAIRISPVKKSVTRYKYDMQDNVIYTRSRDVDIPSQRETEKKKDVCSESSFFYDYDDNGNWTELIFLKDGTPEYIQQREIKYF